TTAGTSLVRSFALPAPTGLVSAGRRAFLAASDGVSGTELWSSNGRFSGTRMVRDIAPGTASSAPGNLIRPGSLLFFSPDDGVVGRELWALSLLNERSLDFDGDLKGDLAVYHPASGLWFVEPSTFGPSYSLDFGGPDYDAVPGDYDGDGRIDAAAYHRPSGIW